MYAPVNFVSLTRTRTYSMNLVAEALKGCRGICESLFVLNPLRAEIPPAAVHEHIGDPNPGLGSRGRR